MKPPVCLKGLIILMFVSALLSSAVPGFAQEDPHFELRTNFVHQHYLSKGGFWIRNDVGFRHYFEETPASMLLLRPRAVIELTGIVDIHPAVDFRLSTYSGRPSTFEIRTWQGIGVAWPDVGRFMFDHFYRFEQRFHWTEGAPEEDVGFRSRYRLRLRVPFNHRIITDKTIFMDLRGEIYLPHDDEIGELFASLIRVGAALAYQQNSRWRYQLLGYFDGGRNTLEDERTVTRSIVEFRIRAMF